MEQIAGVNMTVQLGRAFEDLMEGHNLMGCVFRNRSEVKRDKARDDAKEASAATQTYEDKLRLAKVDAVAPPVDLPNFTLAVNTFTAEVWTYHGEDCPLYKDLLEWVEELKGAELMNERFDFTPAYLRRTMWKMMLEVDRFYGQECTPEMFNRRGGPIPWPTQTKLSSILSKFLDGDEMQSRSFPNEWSSEFYRKKGLNRDRQGGGSHSSSGYQGRGGQGDKSYQTQGGKRQGGGSHNSNGYQGR
jgi:hypothetical protein